MIEELDGLDRRILERLNDDARISYTELAKGLGISDVAVKKRVERLVEKRIIKKFSALLDHKLLGRSLRAYLLLRIAPSDFAPVMEQIRKMEGVLNIEQTIGQYDCLVEVAAADMEELRSITEDKIGNMKGIIEVRPQVVV